MIKTAYIIYSLTNFEIVPRLVQTIVKRMRLLSKIENLLTEHDLRMRKNWPRLLRFYAVRVNEPA